MELERQPVFPLAVVAADGAQVVIGVYKADFRYRTAEGVVVEDCKGFKTALYEWKKRHVAAQYGISITEI